jgi:hypothetical protein
LSFAAGAVVCLLQLFNVVVLILLLFSVVESVFPFGRVKVLFWCLVIKVLIHPKKNKLQHQFNYQLLLRDPQISSSMVRGTRHITSPTLD